jgi:hypothetical protein
MYITGAVIGQLPFTFLFPMFPMNYTIPALEIGWGIFTLLQYRAESFSELMAYRFFVGIFEVNLEPIRVTFQVVLSKISRRPSSLAFITCSEHGIEVTSLGVEAGCSMWVRCLEHLPQVSFKVERQLISTA